MLSGIKNFFSGILYFLSPSHCQMCGRKVLNKRDNHSYFCRNCLEKADNIVDSNEIIHNMVDLLGDDNINITKVFALGKLKDDERFLNVIHSFKYYGKRKIGAELGDILGRKIAESGSKYDLIIPVPIHKAKKRERGFNQSDYIAAAIANQLSIKSYCDIVIRRQYTVSQTLLTAEKRLENMQNVFVVKDKDIIQGKDILLVDDVFTTGATLNSLALALLEAGVNSCDAATIIKS